MRRFDPETMPGWDKPEGAHKWRTPKRQYRAMTLEGMRGVKEAYEVLRSQDDPAEKVWHAHMLLETCLANMRGYVEGTKDWDCP